MRSVTVEKRLERLGVKIVLDIALRALPVLCVSIDKLGTIGRWCGMIKVFSYGKTFMSSAMIHS